MLLIKMFIDWMNGRERMSYNCPKCHCGCLFEERGKLICLNCGAEVSKSAAEGVRHVHTYTTYRGKTPGKRQSVPKKPAPKATVPRPADVFRTADSWESASRTSTGGSSSSAFRSAGARRPTARTGPIRNHPAARRRGNPRKSGPLAA